MSDEDSGLYLSSFPLQYYGKVEKTKNFIFLFYSEETNSAPLVHEW